MEFLPRSLGRLRTPHLPGRARELSCEVQAGLRDSTTRRSPSEEEEYRIEPRSQESRSPRFADRGTGKELS